MSSFSPVDFTAAAVSVVIRPYNSAETNAIAINKPAAIM
jgi:hypothetical protein